MTKKMTSSYSKECKWSKVDLKKDHNSHSDKGISKLT